MSLRCETPDPTKMLILSLGIVVLTIGLVVDADLDGSVQTNHVDAVLVVLWLLAGGLLGHGLGAHGLPLPLPDDAVDVSVQVLLQLL